MQKFILFNFFKKKKIFLTSSMVFLMCINLASAPSSAYSQNTKLKLQLSNVSITQVLEQIRAHSEYRFVYRSDLFDGLGSVSLDVENATIDEILGRILSGKKIRYEIEDKIIIFSKTDDSGTAARAVGQQPGRKVSGKVTDKEGESIPGVSVSVKETPTKGTATDINGEFSITVAEKEHTLVFSFVGMQTQEILINNRNIVNVTLEDDVSMLGEVVVVSTGMVNVDKRLFTGASDRLSAEDVMLGGVADISRSLEGRSAGVSVQNVSATFGTAPKIRVRGATSILGNSKPLWVVDGVIMEDVTEITPEQLSSGDAVTMISSAIAGLNADDIESFTILKDGSATSIYGAKAMAGVVVITTKKGREGKTRINYSGEFTTRLKPSYSEYNIMNSQEQMSVYREMQAKGFLNFSDSFRAAESGVFGKMYQLMNTYNETSGQFGLPNTEEAMIDYLRKAEYRNTNWFGELFSNSVMMNHSVSLSGGSEKLSAYMSLSIMTDPGWYKRSNVNRYTFNANMNYRLLDNLSFNILANGSFREQEAPGSLSQDVDVVFGKVKRDFDINPFSYAMNTSRTMDPKESYTRNYTSFNIFNELANNYIELNGLDEKFQGELNWTILKGLTFNSLASMRYQTSSMQHHIKDNSNQALAYREMSDAVVRDDNPYLYTDPDKINSLPVSILPEGGIYEKREYKTKSYTIRNSVTWNKIFDNSHIFNTYAGMELTGVQRTNDWFRGWGMQYEEGEIAFSNYLAFKKASEENASNFTLSNTNRRSEAYFGTANYSFEGRYNLNGTFRYEGTNRLGRSRSSRWLPTWNVGAAWNAHEERFFQPLLETFSHLNLKMSYSLTADAGPDYITNSTAIIRSYAPWRPTANDKESGLYIEMLGNSDLTYEKKHEFNVGLSLGLFNNRFNFETDFYIRNNFDLLGVTNTQGAGGEIRKYANIADMESKGIEFSFSTRNIETKTFRWATDLTFSWNNHKITKLQSDANMMSLVLGTGYNLQGYAPFSLFSIPFTGIDPDGFPTYQLGGKEITKDNYSLINYQSTDEELLNSLKYEGQTDPVYTGGFGNVFTWKNFRLNLFMTYGFGNKIRLNPAFDAYYSDLYAMPREFVNRWVVAGDESRTDVPVVAGRGQLSLYGSDNISKGYSAYNYSSARAAKGDFIRMKEISLGYDFPKERINSMKVSDLSLKLQVTNPFLIYAHSSLNGQDPEYYQSGGVSSPLAKQITLTLRIGM